MRQGFRARHAIDSDGNPAGGITQCQSMVDKTATVFFYIGWQDGPMQYKNRWLRKPSSISDSGEREDVPVPNGAFVEDVIGACVDRINFYQHVSGGKFSCVENDAAIGYLQEALLILDARTKRRQEASIKGTHVEETQEEDESCSSCRPSPGKAVEVTDSGLCVKCGRQLKTVDL